MPWSALEPSVPQWWCSSTELQLPTALSMAPIEMIPMPRELLNAWSWSCPASPTALIPGKGSCHLQNSGSFRFLWILDTCSLWNSIKRFVFSFPFPNIFNEFTEKSTVSKILGPWDIPSGHTSKQGQCAQDLWSPGAPFSPSSSTFPKTSTDNSISTSFPTTFSHVLAEMLGLSFTQKRCTAFALQSPGMVSNDSTSRLHGRFSWCRMVKIDLFYSVGTDPQRGGDVHITT